MSDHLSALGELGGGIWAKVMIILIVIVMLLGVATEGVVLYGQRKVAAIKAEIANNSDKLQDSEKYIAVQKARIEKQSADNATLFEQAKAEKARADAAVASALADNAKVKQDAESKFAAQKAIVEGAIARYAARTKRAEADKQAAEAVSAEEVAKNSQAKFQAEAEKATLEALQTEHVANITQWINNCAGGRTGGLANCSVKWGCLSDLSGILC